MAGKVLLFDSATLKDIDKADWHSLEPTLMAYVSGFVNGRTEHCSNAELGVIDGVHYHLENEGFGLEIKEGRGEERCKVPEHFAGK